MSSDGKNVDIELPNEVNNALAWVEDDRGKIIAITPPKSGSNLDGSDVDVDEILPDDLDDENVTAYIDVSDPSLLNIPGLQYEPDEFDQMQGAQPSDIANNVQDRADRLIEWCQSDMHLLASYGKQLDAVLHDTKLQNSEKLEYVRNVAAGQIREIGKRSNVTLYPALCDASDLWKQVPEKFRDDRNVVGLAKEALARAILEYEKLDEAYDTLFDTYEKALNLLSQLPAPPPPPKLPDFSPGAVFKTMAARLVQIVLDQTELAEKAEEDADAATRLHKEVKDGNKDGKQEYQQLVTSFQMELNWLWVPGSKWDRLEKQALEIENNFYNNFSRNERDTISGGKEVAHRITRRIKLAKSSHRRIQSALERINVVGYLINNVDLDARLKALPGVAKQIRQQMKMLAKRADSEVDKFGELLDANSYVGLKGKWNKLVEQYKPRSAWIRGGQQQSQWDRLELQLRALLDEFGRIPKKLRSGEDGKKAGRELKKAADKATDYVKAIVSATNIFLDIELTEIADLPDKGADLNEKVFENFLGEFLRPDPNRFIKPPTKEPVADEDVEDLLSDIISKLKEVQQDSANLRKSAEVALDGADDNSEVTWLQFCEHTGFPQVDWAPDNQGGGWDALRRRRVTQVSRLNDLSKEQRDKNDISACKLEISVTDRELEKDKSAALNCFDQLETMQQQLIAKRPKASNEDEAIEIPGLEEIGFNENASVNSDLIEFDFVEDNEDPYFNKVVDIPEEEELDKGLEDTVAKTIEAIEKGIKVVVESVNRMKDQANNDESAAKQVPDANAWPAYRNQTGFPHPAWEHPKKAGGPWRELAEDLKEEYAVFEELTRSASRERKDMKEAWQLLERARRSIENGIRYVEATLLRLHKIQFKVRTAQHHQAIEEKKITGLLNEKAGTEGKKLSLVLWGPENMKFGAKESTLMPIIESKIGPTDVKLVKFAISQLVRPATTNWKEYPHEYSYITLGVVDDRLVLRVNCEGKIFKFKKKCEDATLVKNYSAYAALYQQLVSDKEKMTVESLLIGSHRQYSPMFLSFIKDKYAAENLAFYLKTVDMKPGTPIDQKKREDLFENNIRTDAGAEVNVNFETRKKGEEHALKNEWDEFDSIVFKCREECFKFLSNLLTLWKNNIH